MRKLAMLAAATLAATAIPTAAFAQVTLLNGDNSMPSTAMVHLDASFDNSDVLTVHGITDLGTQVLFTGNVNINGTGFAPGVRPQGSDPRRALPPAAARAG